MDTNRVIGEFGLMIQKKRLKLNISQEDLAFKCGLDRTYISGIERGKRNPSLKNILKITEALNLQFDYLFKYKSNDS